MNVVHTPILFLQNKFHLYLHLHLGRPNGHFPSGFPTRTLYAILFRSTLAKCPALTILFDLVNVILLARNKPIHEAPSYAFFSSIL